MASTNASPSPSRIEASESDGKGSEALLEPIPEMQSLVTKNLLRPIPSEDETHCFEIFEGNIALAGPSIAITGYDPLTMRLDLWHGIDEVSRGFTSICSLFEWGKYDEVITEEVKGRNGAAVVTYAIITNAVIASVEISLVRGNRKSGARIYGTITAYMTGWDVKRVLFCKKRDKYINVDSGVPIPLLRSVLIIPRTSSLHIDADLSDALSFPNVPVASGALQFSPEFYGDFAESISGKYGEIKVNVTWWSYYNHPDTRKVVRRRLGL